MEWPGTLRNPDADQLYKQKPGATHRNTSAWAGSTYELLKNPPALLAGVRGDSWANHTEFHKGSLARPPSLNPRGASLSTRPPFADTRLREHASRHDKQRSRPALSNSELSRLLWAGTCQPPQTKIRLPTRPLSLMTELHGFRNRGTHHGSNWQPST